MSGEDFARRYFTRPLGAARRAAENRAAPIVLGLLFVAFAAYVLFPDKPDYPPLPQPKPID